MTGQQYKDNTRLSEKRFNKKRREECQRFAELLYLKCNRGKEMSLVLAENAEKFPFLSSIAIALLFNNNPMPVYSIINVDIARILEELQKGGIDKQGAEAIDSKETNKE